jgi:hypothetical protein
MTRVKRRTRDKAEANWGRPVWLRVPQQVHDAIDGVLDGWAAVPTRSGHGVARSQLLLSAVRIGLLAIKAMDLAPQEVYGIARVGAEDYLDFSEATSKSRASFDAPRASSL